MSPMFFNLIFLFPVSVMLRKQRNKEQRRRFLSVLISFQYFHMNFLSQIMTQKKVGGPTYFRC